MMAEIKWIKITTDIFDDEKILLIEALPEADSIIVIWFKLLTLSGKQNNDGVLLINDRIPYTDEMLATIFRRNVNIVRLAIETFERFGMVEIVNNTITIPNWEKHQNVDGMEKIREQTRQRVAKHREKQRLLMGYNECQYCGNEATGYDHIVPLARGGSDSEENKVPCCITCNRIKNDKPLVDFLNDNRDRINDDIIAENPKLNKYVTLCNVTDRYIVTQCNATEEDKENDKDKNKEIYTCSLTDVAEQNTPDKPKKTKKEKPAKHKHGDYNNVLLTDNELDKLKAKFPDWEDRIERLSIYMESKCTKYKSHYATILNWARREGNTGRTTIKNSIPKNTGYAPEQDLNDLDDLF